METEEEEEGVYMCKNEIERQQTELLTLPSFFKLNQIRSDLVSYL